MNRLVLSQSFLLPREAMIQVLLPSIKVMWNFPGVGVGIGHKWNFHEKTLLSLF
jgi:hypothetical protein